MTQAKPFKARLGLDANSEKVINVKNPTDLLDAVNLQYHIESNTVQPFQSDRTYPAGFLVERGDRLYKAKADIGIGAFNLNEWTEIHAFTYWQRITGPYVAEPGDGLLVNTSAGSVTISLPFPAEEGDVVTIMDEGFAKTNPIIVSATTNTFDGSPATSYSINSSDTVQFVFLGATWRVNRVVKSIFQYIDTNQTVAPNSWNMVSTVSARTITLPSTPVNGQWVVVADASNNARNNNITVAGNGKTIQGASSYSIKRFSEVLTLVYDGVSGEWKYHTTALESRMIESLSPLASEVVLVTLDATNKAMTLPTTGLVTGDWVEVVVKYQDEVASGSLVITAGGSNYFRLNGGSQNTTSYRVKQRGRYLFVYKANEWTVISSNDVLATPNVSSGSLIANSFTKLVGAAGQTVYLPQSDQIQVGDIVPAVIKSDVSSVVVSVQNTSTDLIDDATTKTFAAADNGLPVMFVYRGWNGSKYVWETITIGDSYLKKTQNLNDLQSKSTARTNLDVFSKGESDARFLGINDNAVSATQAANADKLDNYDSTDFMMVKNPSTIAVDANTTTETRFTTNVGTPNTSEMWQVVNFVDRATGDKSQVAMGRNSTKVAYRAYTASSTTWSSWTYLDQGATASSSNKLETARNIGLVGDVSGTPTPFDGTANINIPVTNVQAAKLKPVVNTPVSPAVGNYSKIGSVVMTQQYDGYVGSLRIIGNKTQGSPTPFVGIQKFSDVLVRMYQHSAIGNTPAVFVLNYGPLEFGYVVVQTSPTVVVDLYIKSSTVDVSYAIAEVQGVSTGSASVVYGPSLWDAVAPVGYVAGSNIVTYDDNYHPLADKWTTPRKITVTGSGITGETTLDGSSDVTLNLSVDSGVIGEIPISQVTGLQTALDGKLETTGTAADSSKLGGANAGDYAKAVAGTNSGEDPNSTVTSLILTNHVNTPDAGTSYWYIETKFYETRTITSNRIQYATQYNGSVGVYTRQYYGGAWSAWSEVGNTTQSLIAIWTGI